MSVAFVLTPLGTQLQRVGGNNSESSHHKCWGGWYSKPVIATLSCLHQHVPERGWKHILLPRDKPAPRKPALAEENGVEEGKVFQVFQELSQRMELGMQSGEEQ